MVKGPCRGKLCDFWARIRIRKKTVENLVKDIKNTIIECDKGSNASTRDLLGTYWDEMGVRDMERLCEEEPDLCEKIMEVESQFL